MHVKRFLHTLLAPVIHLKRINTLTLLVNAALKEKKLSVTQLGRSIVNNAQEKNNIKLSDRYLSNTHVHAERCTIYKNIATQLIKNKPHPWIIVDWSHVPNTTHYILRAAVVLKGRALSLYEEVHPKKLENNPVVHKKFLAQLKELLAKQCRPIIVTDAGFHNSWFKAVQEIGWDYVGRVRGNKYYRLNTDNKWVTYRESCTIATIEGKALGEGYLTKTKPMATNIYLIRLPKKNRVSLNKLKKKSHYKSDKEHGRSAKEPWLLTSSLKKRHLIQRCVFKVYKARMQIEEGFRDLKSSQYGFSFEKAQSQNIERIQILLMIAMVASMIAYLTGLVAEKNQWHYQFQANSLKKRRVLSLFYLGCRIIKKNIKVPIQALFEALRGLWMELEWAT